MTSLCRPKASLLATKGFPPQVNMEGLVLFNLGCQLKGVRITVETYLGCIFRGVSRKVKLSTHLSLLSDCEHSTTLGFTMLSPCLLLTWTTPLDLQAQPFLS